MNEVIASSSQEKAQKNKVFNFLKALLWWTTLPILLMILVYLLDQYLIPNNLKKYGIIARDFSNLPGILFSPFIHANLNHLISNIISLWTLLLVLLIFYKKFYWIVLITITLLSGMLTWIIGDEGIHIGSSGVVYGLAAFIFFSGFIQRQIAPISASFMIFFAYRYLIGGLFPQHTSTTNDISYSSHWSGVISGFIIAFIIAYKVFQQKNKEQEYEVEEN